MARYSREQRERAVGLYERYGHSAADVIRELGIPVAGRCAYGTGTGWRNGARESPRDEASVIRGTRTSRNTPRWSIT